MSAPSKRRPGRGEPAPPPGPAADPQGPDRMDIQLIRRLVRLMNGGKISELEIDDTQNGLRVRLKRGGQETAAPASPVVYHVPGAAAPAPVGMASAPSLAGAAPAAAAGAADPGLAPITSPLVGTFYRSPSPDSDPFVEVGKRVGAESIVCIIEAMKVMNEIKAEFSGEIVQILVENGDPVEFGQPLFLVKKG